MLTEHMYPSCIEDDALVRFHDAPSIARREHWQDHCNDSLPAFQTSHALGWNISVNYSVYMLQSNRMAGIIEAETSFGNVLFTYLSLAWIPVPKLLIVPTSKMLESYCLWARTNLSVGSYEVLCRHLLCCYISSGWVISPAWGQNQIHYNRLHYSAGWSVQKLTTLGTMYYTRIQFYRIQEKSLLNCMFPSAICS